MKAKLIEAIVTNEHFKNYIMLCQEDAENKQIKAEKVFKRREKYANKILLSTSCCGLDSTEAKSICMDFLATVDTSILKNVEWLAEI